MKAGNYSYKNCFKPWEPQSFSEQCSEGCKNFHGSFGGDGETQRQGEAPDYSVSETKHLFQKAT